MNLDGVDIGTLTCRLLIANLPTDGQLRELHAVRIVRLGQDVDKIVSCIGARGPTSMPT